MLRPYLQKKLEENVSFPELLRYCSMHKIKIQPYVLRRHFKQFYQRNEEAPIYRLGLLADNKLADLIDQYAKYMCLKVRECGDSLRNSEN